MLRRGFGCAAFVGFAVVVFGAVLLFAAPRPRDTTEARVVSGDGAALDYCQLPELDGSGKRAEEIPKAFTPGCGWERWPMPVLAECTEPLAPGVVDVRGLWMGRAGDRVHVERIEQCGNRLVVTSSGILHDLVTDGTLGNGARDVQPPRCMNIAAAVEWNDGVLEFRPFGLPFVLVRRQLRGNSLHWTYPVLGEVRLERICRVPESASNG